MRFEISTVKSRPDLAEQMQKLYAGAFPKFMGAERVMRTYWKFVEEEFSDYQILLTSEDKVIAIVNSGAFNFDGDNAELDEGGIYWGLKKIASDFYKNKKPNAFMALQITINPDYKGKRLSYICVKELIRLGKEKGYTRLFIPIRPSAKFKYPLMDSEKYFSWTNEEGLPFDPWIRVHVKLGATIVKKCNGIFISGTISEWEDWTGLKFPYSGEYIVPGALQPIKVDIEKGTVEYSQENLWLVHDLTKDTVGL